MRGPWEGYIIAMLMVGSGLSRASMPGWWWWALVLPLLSEYTNGLSVYAKTSLDRSLNGLSPTCLSSTQINFSKVQDIYRDFTVLINDMWAGAGKRGGSGMRLGERGDGSGIKMPAIQA